MISLEQVGWILAPTPARTLLADLYPFLEPAFEEFDIDSDLRQAHFLAQAAWETDRFTTLQEYASGDAYDTREDLGNTPERDGDGRRYNGKGIMMLTGKDNVARCSVALFGDRSVLLEDPWLLCDDFETAVRSGAWYWFENDLNRYADANDIRKVTRKINGGTNGLEGRRMLYDRAARAYGLIS